jgi:hypothetical protein
MVVKSWSCFENIAIGIVNPRPVFKFPKPDGMSSEEFERIIELLEKELDEKSMEDL